jgi:hypothetical protein
MADAQRLVETQSKNHHRNMTGFRHLLFSGYGG